MDSLTPAEIEQLEPIEGPLLYGCQFRVQASGTDLMVLVQRLRPATVANEFAGAAKVETSAIIAMSFHAAKDLSILLADTVKRMEEESLGPVQTEFTRKRGG
jgi:hypothetical protein